ncbi:OmpH family outer membrane protein [Flavobacterium cheongpyeongense]|uniref:OmpH family outer membrane protein n=1 Tax=Flavobacterium cheongpyeongense TaxID=2212651 RepID=UPI0014041CB9|nr:OmpH family outer membrane protein [Flavobacterium cheongpyeongense]
MIIVNILLIGVLTLFFFFQYNKQIVYIDNVKLFDGFVMTKEMKRAGEKEFNSRKSVLDKLYSDLQSSSISASERKQLMQQFIQGKEELEQFNQVFGSEQSLKIWARIKSYTTEFSRDKNYKLVIGSDNKQTVLFADEKIDVTNELLTYINKRYEGL